MFHIKSLPLIDLSTETAEKVCEKTASFVFRICRALCCRVCNGQPFLQLF